MPVEESYRYEFKEIRGENPVRIIRKQVDKYIVGFLNAKGGRIFWGIHDDGTVIGVSLDQKQRDEVKRIITEQLLKIEPKIDPSFYHLELHPVYDGNVVLADTYVIEVIVPYRKMWKPYYAGGTQSYVRTNSVTAKLQGTALTDWIIRRERQRKNQQENQQGYNEY